MTRVNKAEEKAYEYIKNQIVTGSWPPPTKIIEQDISNVLEISRSPVRSAIKRLADEGLLEVEPYKGAVVANKRLNKQEFVDRMEMLEMLLQQYLYLLESHNFHLDIQMLKDKVTVVNDAINDRASTKQIAYLGAQLMETLLVEQSNRYIRKTIISISEDILNVDFPRTSQTKVLALYQLFISGLSKTIEYLRQDDFPKARKEIRIFVNRLMLEVIDQPLAS